MVPRAKIRDVVAQGLKSYIASHDLKPGDRLPTEGELASHFGVSRLSLREATKALEFLGIVQAKPGLGLTVGEISLERVTGYLELHPAVREASLLQLIETRIVIETGVLPYVMRSMQVDPAVHAQLRALNDQLRRARHLAQWVQRDIAFHRGLVESSGLSPLLAINDLLAVFFLRFRESVKRAEWKQGIESHERMLDALAAQKLDVASDELRQHVESHKARMDMLG